jgi:hypothetical protein
MTVNQRARLGQRLEREHETPGGMLGGEKFFEQHRL